MPVPLPVSEHLELSVHTVETAPYDALDITALEWPQWIVSHVLRGEVETTTAGERSIVRAGDVMVHPPHRPFSERSGGPGVHQWLAFEATVAETPALPLLTRCPVPFVVPLGEARETFTRTFESLEAVWQGPTSPARGLRTAAHAALLLSLLVEAWQDSGLPPRPTGAQMPPDRFGEVIAYMEAHLGERLTRDDLARRAFLHPGYFDRAFRAAYGQPPMRLLQEIRLRRVRHLLLTTDAPLESVAARCGLGDAARLGRTFRARYGLPPGVWRESAKRTSDSYITPLPTVSLMRHNGSRNRHNDSPGGKDT